MAQPQAWQRLSSWCVDTDKNGAPQLAAVREANAEQCALTIEEQRRYEKKAYAVMMIAVQKVMRYGELCLEAVCDALDLPKVRQLQDLVLCQGDFTDQQCDVVLERLEFAPTSHGVHRSFSTVRSHTPVQAANEWSAHDEGVESA